MDYKIFSSNRSILQSSAIHPIIATADKSGHFVPVGVTSAFVLYYYNVGRGQHHFIENQPKNHRIVFSHKIIKTQLAKTHSTLLELPLKVVQTLMMYQ